MTEKQCTKCFTVQPVENFGKQPNNNDGLKSYCKTCNKEYMRQYRQQKGAGLQEKERAYARQYKTQHQNIQPEQVLHKLQLAVERCKILGVEIPPEIMSN